VLSDECYAFIAAHEEYYGLRAIRDTFEHCRLRQKFGTASVPEAVAELELVDAMITIAFELGHGSEWADRWLTKAEKRLAAILPRDDLAYAPRQETVTQAHKRKAV
jgi:hypothetical protein